MQQYMYMQPTASSGRCALFPNLKLAAANTATPTDRHLHCALCYSTRLLALLQAAALRAVQQGHDIGSHAAEHLDLTKLAPAQLEQQIAWGIGNISSLTGSSTVPVSIGRRGSCAGVHTT